jgi:hypothetical protein
MNVAQGLGFHASLGTQGPERNSFRVFVLKLTKEAHDICTKPSSMEPTALFQTITQQIIRWATQGSTKTLARCTSLQEVCAALARTLQRDDILTLGRLVQRSGTTFASYRIDEILGNRRRLLFLGTPLTSQAASNAETRGEGNTDTVSQPTVKHDLRPTLTLEDARAMQEDLRAGFITHINMHIPLYITYVHSHTLAGNLFKHELRVH